MRNAAFLTIVAPATHPTAHAAKPEQDGCVHSNCSRPGAHRPVRGQAGPSSPARDGSVGGIRGQGLPQDCETADRVLAACPLALCTPQRTLSVSALPLLPQVAGLRSDNDVIKSRSIVAARELLIAPEKHIQCIAAGITSALRDLLVQQSSASTAAEGAPSDVPDLQAATAATLQLLVAKEVGCRDALQHGCLTHVLQLLKQPSTAVREAAYGCLRAAAMYEPWRTALVREGALPALLMYAQQEEPQRAAWALDLLHHCTQVRVCCGALKCIPGAGRHIRDVGLGFRCSY